MTDTWKTHTPEYDGHAPDDWDGREVECRKNSTYDWHRMQDTNWLLGLQYRYRAKQPDLLAQCLALPQADREALIEALQKPQRDWADDVADAALHGSGVACGEVYDAAAAVIRSMCRPKEVVIDDEVVRKFAHELANQPYFGIASILTRFVREALS